MKKMLLFCFFIPSIAIAQTTLFRFEENGKTGYMDSLQHVLIQPQFDWGDHFSEGMAAVFRNGKLGYIDRRGETVIQPRFSSAGSFIDGVAIVSNDKLYGLIDRRGKFILKPVYQHIQFRSEGKIGVRQNDRWGFYTLNGKRVTPVRYKWIGAFSEGLAMVQSPYDSKYGFIDEHGRTVIPLTLKTVYSDFQEGYASVDDSLGRCFIDREGKNAFGKYYDNTSDFSNGRAFVKDRYDMPGYFIDTGGRQVTDPIFTSSWGFSEGFCGASTDSGFVVIDTAGTILFRSTTIELRFYDGDFGFFCDHSGKSLTWGIMNKKQEIISNQRFTRIEALPQGAFVETVIGVPGEFTDGKRGYMDISGEHFWQEELRLYIPIR